jgi:hypothetical protein
MNDMHTTKTPKKQQKNASRLQGREALRCASVVPPCFRLSTVSLAAIMLTTQRIIPLAGLLIPYSFLISDAGHEHRTSTFTLSFTGPFYSNNGIGFQRFQLSVTV